MSGETILRHITAAVLSALFVMAVILAVMLLAGPYALVPLILFTPVGLIAAVLIWVLLFARMPLLSKIVRFGLYVLTCTVLAVLTLQAGKGFFDAVLVTSFVPPLVLVVFGLFFPAPPVVATAELPPEPQD